MANSEAIPYKSVYFQLSKPETLQKASSLQINLKRKCDYSVKSAWLIKKTKKWKETSEKTHKYYKIQQQILATSLFFFKESFCMEKYSILQKEKNESSLNWIMFTWTDLETKKCFLFLVDYVLESSLGNFGNCLNASEGILFWAKELVFLWIFHYFKHFMILFLVFLLWFFSSV